MKLIVVEFNGDWAIVQAGNFSTLFILSRKQNVPAEQLDVR
jgi:lipocalin